MEKYCDSIMGRLSDPTGSDELIVKAATFVDKAAARDFHRDNIRTEPFTEKVKSYCEGAVTNGG